MPVAAAKAGTSGPAYLQWRGNTYTAFGERLKGYIGQAAELAPQLEAAQQQGSAEEQLALLEKLISAFSEAKGIVRHSFATSGGTAPASTRTDMLVLVAVCVTGHAMLRCATTCPARVRALPGLPFAAALRGWRCCRCGR